MQQLDGGGALVKRRHRVFVQVHTDAVAHLVGSDLRVDARSMCQTGVSPAEHLEVDPAETNLLQSRTDPAPPDVLEANWVRPVSDAKSHVSAADGSIASHAWISDASIDGIAARRDDALDFGVSSLPA